ncbi:MAG: hypothetical protein PHS97_04210 [Oscillospiraceae bacterium]|nr:hypothetical protein [Oscillospiraceae bacterium]
MKSKIDKRLLYILPSILALCISITALHYQFSNQLFDMNNTCYYSYVNAAQDEQTCLAVIDETLWESKVTGFTILKNLQGGYLTSDNTYAFNESYQVVLMDISRDKAQMIAVKLKEAFEQDIVLVGEVVMTSYFMSGENKAKSLTD